MHVLWSCGWGFRDTAYNHKTSTLDCKWYKSLVPPNPRKTNTFREPLFVYTIKTRAFETPVCKGFSNTILTFAGKITILLYTFHVFSYSPKMFVFVAPVPSPWHLSFGYIMITVCFWPPLFAQVFTQYIRHSIENQYWHTDPRRHRHKDTKPMR